MDFQNTISRKNDVLLINEMFFDLTQVRSVDVVRLSRPIWKLLALILIIYALLLSAVFVIFEISYSYEDILIYVSLFILVGAVISLTASFLQKTLYSLVIYTKHGSTSTVISSEYNKLIDYKIEINSMINCSNIGGK